MLTYICLLLVLSLCQNCAKDLRCVFIFPPPLKFCFIFYLFMYLLFCPQAAAKFRQFWGDKAELRRFQDGNIAEAVVWECGPAERHSVVDRSALPYCSVTC